MPLTQESLQSTPAFAKGGWYYTMELAPGVWTKGEGFRNVAMTRDLIRRTDIAGEKGSGPARCLDIGIMEGLLTVLLERRGAAEVVAYDRLRLDERLDLVREAYGAKFKMVSGMKLAELPRALEAAGHKAPFDVVVFSGVMYHLFDPLGLLAMARGLVREGGIMLVETVVTYDDSQSMHFNTKGKFYRGKNYWHIPVPLFEYMLRFMKLEPLDCNHVFASTATQTGVRAGRVAIACRATADFPRESDDPWMGQYPERDYADFLDWQAVRSDKPPVAYNADRPGLVRRKSGGGIDVLASTRNMPELAPGEDDMRLRLDARE
jgi:tRNA (mo5U34)-methyltransferase